ncbi:ATP-binding protein [Streptacidiphilus cavernicola]|uniref:histidine kinase n=1 Tax=Streptacidiphilus cavernicola TaxID=3342716 RepID=A0ABV6W4T4_9ACTN
MVRAGASPRGRRSESVLAWLLPAVLTAAASVVAVALVAHAARAQVAVCGAVATVAVAVLAAEAARRGRVLAALRAREAALDSRLAQQERRTAQLGQVLLPEAVARIQQGEYIEDVLREAASADADESADFKAAHQVVLRSVLEAVTAEEDLRESAQRAFVNIARRVQAIVHRQAQDLQDMEHRHGRSPEVFADLLRLDHGTALVGRLADSIAVLGGARPGRQWSKAVPLYSVLRGAMSRILDYQRVELHSVSEVAVVGPAVEPLIHALAELLDNATRYSPPQTRVHLTAVDVQTGIAVEIEDGGLSLTEEGRARAERMLREAQAGIDLTDLGETPRLGLAVVGRLARAYDFQVSLRPSAYGGVRAVLIIPQDLITTAPATGRAHGIGASSGLRPSEESSAAVPSAPAQAVPSAPAQPVPVASPVTVPAPSAPAPAVPQQAPAVPVAAAAAQQHRPWSAEEDDVPVVTERTPSGLPQRRRHAAPAQGRPTAVPRPAAVAVEAAEEPAVAPGLWLSAFQDGANGQVSTSAPVGPVSDVVSDEVE